MQGAIWATAYGAWKPSMKRPMEPYGLLLFGPRLAYEKAPSLAGGG
jgi:hypothetical protein